MSRSPCERLLGVAMPRSFSRNRKEKERWSRFPDFQKKFSRYGSLGLLSKQRVFAPIVSLWVESSRDINIFLLRPLEGSIWMMFESTINQYGEVKYKFCLDFVLASYWQTVLPKQFIHLPLVNAVWQFLKRTKLSCIISECKQFVVNITPSKMCAELLQPKLPNQASLLDKFKEQGRNFHLIQIIQHVLAAYK